MNDTAEVYLWGTRIGIIHQDGSRPYASFEYDRGLLTSGIEVAPLRMPLSGNVYEFPSLAGDPFYGMPGLVADSLPDRFGNAVIERWLNSLGRSLSDFNAIDRLCYTGKRGMGALEYVPASSDIKDIDEDINIREMVRFASDILTDRERISLKVTDGWISGESGMMSRSVHCHGDLHAGICNIRRFCGEQIRMRSLAS